MPGARGAGFPPLVGEMSEGQRGREGIALPTSPLDGCSIR